MTKDNVEIENIMNDEVEVENIEDKGPTKKDIKKLESVYSDILNQKEFEIDEISELSDSDKKSLLKISKFIDECRYSNRVSSREYVKVREDEDVKELNESDFSSFGSISSYDYDN